MQSRTRAAHVRRASSSRRRARWLPERVRRCRRRRNERIGVTGLDEHGAGSMWRSMDVSLATCGAVCAVWVWVSVEDEDYDETEPFGTKVTENASLIPGGGFVLA